MNTSLIKVKPLENYELELTYGNGEERIFDMKAYLNIGLFKELKDVSKFNTVKISFDTVEWENGADFDPEVLFEQSKILASK